MIHRLKPLIVILVIAALVGGGYWYFSQNPALLTDLKLRLGLITEAEASGIYSVSGFIEAEEISVSPQIKGRITFIGADEGDFVEAGQPIVELDTDVLEVEIQQTLAKIATAKANLAKVETGIRAEEIATAEAAVAVAEANAAAASTRWQDAITLRDNPQELDRQIDAARTALELAELQIAQRVPLKDVGEAMWELGKQQVTDIEKGVDLTIEVPDDPADMSVPGNITLEEELAGAAPGDDIRAHLEFKEGTKRQAWEDWNLAGADMWEAWVDLNTAVTARDDAETALNDLLRLRNDPQEAEVMVAQAETAYQTALAEVGVAEAQLESLKSYPRPEQVAVAEAQVKQAEASLEALQVQRDKHTLTTPVAGWVVERVAHEGEMAVAGTTLLTLADLTNVTLTVYVPEPDIGTVTIGQTVNVFVDSFPGQPFPGRITYISDEAEFTPKNVQTKEERMNTVFAVKIKLENPDQLLKPGMPADAVLSESPEL
jgi:multidrug efflux pump subunit AcrA (membrane-fusion protein)